MGRIILSAEPVASVAAHAPLLGMTAGTMVLTLDGELPVQFLAPGDRVITRSGARVLKAIEVVVVRDAQMMRITASALGHDRPETDLYLAPAQNLVIRDWRAKALYGTEVATVEAHRLADGEFIRRELVAEVRLFTLQFATPEVVYAGGLELVCPAMVAAG